MFTIKCVVYIMEYNFEYQISNNNFGGDGLLTIHFYSTLDANT